MKRLMKQVIPNLRLIPVPIWIITLLIYFTPFLFDQSDGDTELIWFVYIIPAFIFSYYLGLWGGLSIALISFITELIWEMLLEQNSDSFDHGNYLIVLIQASMSFGIAFGIGLLADRVKKINLELYNADKTEVVSHLAASFGHEVRNPIAVSRGFLQLLLEENISPEKRKEYAKIALDELDNAERIIQSYLTFAKPQIERKEFLDFKKEINTVVESIVPMTHMNSVDLHVILPPETSNSLIISGNRNHLHQCLLNILKNSIEAMNTGGILKIEILTFREKIGVRISDTGIGMSQEQIKRLGQPYFSTKEKGTGLGMMVVYSIIKEMNGKIKVESEPGKGTTFTLLFPPATEDGLVRDVS